MVQKCYDNMEPRAKKWSKSNFIDLKEFWKTRCHSPRPDWIVIVGDLEYEKVMDVRQD